MVQSLLTWMLRQSVHKMVTLCCSVQPFGVMHSLYVIVMYIAHSRFPGCGGQPSGSRHKRAPRESGNFKHF